MRSRDDVRAALGAALARRNDARLAERRHLIEAERYRAAVRTEDQRIDVLLTELTTLLRAEES